MSKSDSDGKRAKRKPTPAEIAAKGGRARADVLTPEQKAEIAKKAAAARWGVKPLLATHRGNFREEFGVDIECYVVDDEQKTAVVSQRGLGAAIGMDKSGGQRLPRFLRGEKIAPYLGHGLIEKIAKPLVFQWTGSGTNTRPDVPINGYDVTILIDICKAIMAAHADGRLLPSQQRFVQQARVIVTASAKAGIKGLVYALAGYDVTRAEVIEAFKLYVREEARDYEKEFPEQLYGEWYRLYNLTKPEEGSPWKFKDLTITQVYRPLARSNGHVLTLTRMQKAVSDDRRAKLHQFLSEIGVKALRTHLGQLLGIAQFANNRDEYEQRVVRAFGGQQAFDFGRGKRH